MYILSGDSKYNEEKQGREGEVKNDGAVKRNAILDRVIGKSSLKKIKI